tara:strand:- start:1492 stop:1689 length:198 start_codon:yes stop_codon:yes gene_type:complete
MVLAADDSYEAFVEWADTVEPETRSMLYLILRRYNVLEDVIKNAAGSDQKIVQDRKEKAIRSDAR